LDTIQYLENNELGSVIYKSASSAKELHGFTEFTGTMIANHNSLERYKELL